MRNRSTSHRGRLLQDEAWATRRAHDESKARGSKIEANHNDFENLAAMVLKRLDDIFEGIRQLGPGEIAAATKPRAIRLPEVLEILGISKSALYDWLSVDSPSHDPALPRPFKLGQHDRSPSVWWHHEVVAYLKFHADQQRAS